jgi:hypothetical protein
VPGEAQAMEQKSERSASHAGSFAGLNPLIHFKQTVSLPFKPLYDLGKGSLAHGIVLNEVDYAVECTRLECHWNALAATPTWRELFRNVPHHSLDAGVHPRAVKNVCAIEKYLPYPVG